MTSEKLEDQIRECVAMTTAAYVNKFDAEEIDTHAKELADLLWLKLLESSKEVMTKGGLNLAGHEKVGIILDA